MKTLGNFLYEALSKLSLLKQIQKGFSDTEFIRILQSKPTVLIVQHEVIFLLVRMLSHCFLYNQSVDFESPCYQDFMRAGRNLALLGTVASSKAHFHVYDNFWQLKTLWK